MHTVFFFKQKTAYEMRISDWSSDVCSSDLPAAAPAPAPRSPPPPTAMALRAAAPKCASAHRDAVAPASRQQGRPPSSPGPQLSKPTLSTSTLASRRWRTTSEIGRAACRERGGQYVWFSGVVGSCQKKIKSIQLQHPAIHSTMII